MTESEFNKALNEVKTVVSTLEAQDLETLGFVPTLEFEVLHPEDLKNMVDCGYITR